MDSMPLLDDDFNINEINLDFLESPPPRSKPKIATNEYGNIQNNIEVENGIQMAGDFKTNSNDFKAINLDFLNSPEKPKPKVHYSPKYAKTASNIKSEQCATTTSTAFSSSKTLAKRIADVDGLVRQLHDFENENKNLKKQLEDFNNSAKEIQILYTKERNARVEAEAKIKALEAKFDEVDTELAGKTLELDQLQAQMDECSGPTNYSELAMRYLRLSQKLDEERLLHWHDQPLYKDIERYCKEKGFKIPKITPRSPPKRKASSAVLQKTDAQVQCDLWQAEKVKANEKAPQRDQATQSVRIETRNQACQHIGTTTTRSTTTDCFFKYHDVGTNCDPVDFEPAFSAILDELRNFNVDFVAPLSPIADVLEENEPFVPPISPLIEPIDQNLHIEALTAKEFSTIGVNTVAPNVVERKNVGCCTYICNVQRPIDFVVQPTPQPPLISIKRSNSRPPSTTAGLNYETIKDELNSRSSNSSPLNFNINQLPQAATATILPNAFDELWQIFGHMLFSLLNRRLPNTNMASGHVGATSNVSNQQDFYNWLYALYNNVQQQSTQNNQTNNQMNSSSAVPAAANRATTPVNFSDAIPNPQTTPNAIRPTAVRSQPKHNDAETNTATAPPIKLNPSQKSIATSPIRCLSITPTNLRTDVKSPSAFQATSFKDLESKNPNLNLADMELDLTCHKNAACHKKQTKRSRSRNLSEVKPKAAQNVEQENMKTDLQNGRKAELTGGSLQRLNSMLFGSESSDETDTDTEMQIIESCEEMQHSTASSSADTTLSENESETNSRRSRHCSSSSVASNSSNTTFDEGNEIYENTKQNSNDEGSLDLALEIDKKLLDQSPKTAEIADNHIEKSIAVAAIQKTNTQLPVQPILDTPSGTASTTTSKVARKRKIKATTSPSTTSLTTTTTTTTSTPCKRSARLLAKQENQQANIINKTTTTTKQKLPLLTLDCGQVVAKKSPKLSNENNSLDNAFTKSTYALRKSKQTVDIPHLETQSTDTSKSWLTTFSIPATAAANDLSQINTSKILSTCDVQSNSSNSKIIPTISKNLDFNNANNNQELSNNLVNHSENGETNTCNSQLPATAIVTHLYAQKVATTSNELNNTPTTTSAKSSVVNFYTTQQARITQNRSSNLFAATTTLPASRMSSSNIATPTTTTFNSPTTQTTKQQTSLKFCKAFETNKTQLKTPNLGLESNNNVQTTAPNFLSGSTTSTTCSTTSLTTMTTSASTNPNTATAAVAVDSSSSNDLTCSVDLGHQNQTTTSSIITSNNFIKFDTPPASPTPCSMPDENESIENPVKEIPLELTQQEFPTWRRWRQQQRSLMHQLISVYDAKFYQGFHSVNANEITKPAEKVKLLQLQALINDYLTAAPSTISAKVLDYQLQEITNESKLLAQALLLSKQKQQRALKKNYTAYAENCGAMLAETTAAFQDPFTKKNLSTQALLGCSYILQEFTTATLQLLLQQIDSLLFDIKNADGLSLYEALNLTDLYLLTLQHLDQRLDQLTNETTQNPARLFIAKCLYYHKLKAPPMIYLVLCAYPTVLPHREQRNYDNSDPLITVIKHCLMCYQYDTNNSELMQRELLSKLRFEYHFECFKPDFHEVLNNLVEKLRQCKLFNLKFAFAIFCKRLPAEKVMNSVLQQHFMPLANEFYRQVTSAAATTQFFEARTAALLDCFSTVIKPFPRADVDISNYLHILKGFLDIHTSPAVQEAAIHAILRLQRFDFLACYQALAHLRLSTSHVLQPHTKAALRTFIYRKPWSFWRALIMQGNV